MSAESPEGTSTASTRAPARRAASMAAIAAANGPSGGRARPVPKSASTTTSPGPASIGAVGFETGTPGALRPRAHLPGVGREPRRRHQRDGPHGPARLRGGAAPPPSRPRRCSRRRTPPRRAPPARRAPRAASATARPARSISVERRDPEAPRWRPGRWRASPTMPTSLMARLPPGSPSPPPRRRRA